MPRKRKSNPFDKDHPAVERGPVELMNQCEYYLGPRALATARRIYRQCCLRLYDSLRRHFRRRP